MTITARLLDVAGAELIRFGPSEPVILNRFELGYPTARDSAVDLPGRDGEFDTTSYTGASAITMDLTIRDNDVVSRDVWLDRVRRYAHPRLRAYLHVTKDGWGPERRMYVRGAGAPAVFEKPGFLPVQVGYRAPMGVMEAATASTATLFPTASAAGGVDFALTFPLTFDPGNVDGSTVVTNNGTATAYPYVDIYGFCANPAIANLTTGEQVSFTGLTIQAGEFVRVDMQERVVLLLNDRGQSRYSLLDFTTSSFWGLSPGSSLIVFVPESPGSSCQAILTWRDTTI